MARYYFDVLAGQALRRDRVGVELPDLPGAVTEAIARATRLLKQQAAEGEDPRSWMLIARGQDLNVIFVLKLSMVLASLLWASTRLH